MFLIKRPRLAGLYWSYLQSTVCLKFAGGVDSMDKLYVDSFDP